MWVMSDPATFRAHLNTPFHVATGTDDVPLVLIDVSETPIRSGVRQFTLLLHGPPDALLPQGTYELRHDDLGSLTWFMVPIAGSNRERIVYQVCYSSLGG
jgi:hypothetical protein